MAGTEGIQKSKVSTFIQVQKETRIPYLFPTFKFSFMALKNMFMVVYYLATLSPPSPLYKEHTSKLKGGRKKRGDTHKK